MIPIIPTAITIILSLTLVWVQFGGKQPPIFLERERLILVAIYLGAIIIGLATWLIWSLNK